MRNHPKFARLVEAVDGAPAGEMSDEAVSCVLLSLRRYEVLATSAELHRLFTGSLQRLGRFSLPHVSMWTLAVKDEKGNGRLAIAASLPVVDAHLDQSRTLDDAKLLSICLLANQHLITGHLAAKYNSMLQRLLDEGVLNKDSPVRVLTKILTALKLCLNHAPVAATSIRLLELVSEAAEFDTFTVSSVNKSLATFFEPVQLTNRTEALACQWLDSDAVGAEHLEFLSSISQYAPAKRRVQLELLLTKILLANENAAELEPYFYSMFAIIRRMKISSTKFIDLFWNSVIKCAVYPQRLFFRAISWYMFFNNNLGGTYRFAPLLFAYILG